MGDCMYIGAQSELDEPETYLEWYKTKQDLKAVAEKAIAALSEAFALVSLLVEEAINSFSDWYLEITREAAEDVYKPRPKPKRPQRNLLLRYEPMLDKRAQIRQRRSNKCL